MSGWGQILKGGAIDGGALPTGQGFVNWFGSLPSLTAGWGEFMAGAVDVVGDADFDSGCLVETIDYGDSEVGDAINHHGVTE